MDKIALRTKHGQMSFIGRTGAKNHWKADQEADFLHGGVVSWFMLLSCLRKWYLHIWYGKWLNICCCRIFCPTFKRKENYKIKHVCLLSLINWHNFFQLSIINFNTTYLHFLILDIIFLCFLGLFHVIKKCACQNVYLFSET